MTAPVQVAPAPVRDPRVLSLLDALTAELASAGYTPEQTFGYSADRLEQVGVHLVTAAAAEGRVVGIGGIEVHGTEAELKRFYVVPDARGTGVAAALLHALIEYAHGNGVRLLRLETGDKQRAAIRFYRSHGFAEIPRFGPYVDSATSICMQQALASAR